MNTIENKNETVEVSGEKIWKKHGFFNTIKCDFNMEKVNYPGNTLFYKNQAYLTVKKNKKIFYCDYFILSQIVESSNPPKNILSYTFRENEFRMIRPKYDTSTGEFKGLYETIGFFRGVLTKFFSVLVMIKTNPKSFILTTEGKFQVLSPALSLIVIEV